MRFTPGCKCCGVTNACSNCAGIPATLNFHDAMLTPMWFLSATNVRDTTLNYGSRPAAIPATINYDGGTCFALTTITMPDQSWFSPALAVKTSICPSGGTFYLWLMVLQCTLRIRPVVLCTGGTPATWSDKYYSASVLFGKCVPFNLTSWTSFDCASQSTVGNTLSGSGTLITLSARGDAGNV